MAKISELRVFAPSVAVVIGAVVLSAIPHLAFVRAATSLYGRGAPPFAIPTGLEVTREPIPTGTPPPKNDVSSRKAWLQSKLHAAFDDPELAPRSARLLTVENPTDLDIAFALCDDKESCVTMKIAAHERSRHRWSVWKRDLKMRYDSDTTDEKSTKETPVLQAIATADSPSPRVPHYMFEQNGNAIDLVLRSIE